MVSEKDCPCFDDLLLFGTPGAKHLRNPVKMCLEYLMGNMRNAKISRLSCVVLVFLLGVISNHHLVAGGEELVTNGDGNQAVSEESGTSQSPGLGKFSALPFHVSVSVRGGYDDNVVTAAFDRKGSAFVNVNLALTYAFGTPRTAISLQTNGGITDYFDQPGGINFDFNPNVNFSLIHKATPRLTLSLTSYATYQNQPDFALNAGLNRRSGSFFYATNKFSGAYRWAPRFSTVTSYTLGMLYYNDSSIGDFENRLENTFGNEFRFLLWPTTTLVAEYRLGIIVYDMNSPRDSTTQFFLAGFDHSFSPRFNISTRAGVEFRSYTNLNDNRTDPYFEGTLIYALGSHMSLSWSNRFSIEEPDVIGSQARTTFRTALSGNYKLTARIAATVSASYQHDNNDSSFTFVSPFPFPIFQPAFVEDSLSLSLALRYAINRTWGAELGYDFTDVLSDIRLREYYRNRFYGGVNFTF